MLGVLAPVIQTHDYQETNLSKTQHGPDSENWLGTDRLGRDIYTRVVWGIQTTVIITVTTFVTGSLFLGVTMGLVAGYFRGIIDVLIMRAGEVISAFPDILLIILLAATLRPRIVEFARSIEDSTGLTGLVSSGVVDYVVIGIALLPLSWFGMMRLVRGQVLQGREMDYVLAARALGANDARIILHHIVPNCFALFIILATINLGYAILVEASLSFLGIGVPPDVPSWGGMLAGVGIAEMQSSWWLVVFPSLFLAAAVFGINWLGDALRDVLDPRLRGTT